jgi:putative ABC transport system permease protein
MSRVARAIDERFASSDNPTRTQSEAAFAKMFGDMLGNIQDYIRNIGLAVAFSLTLVAANAMAMSMRERTTEIAVLKAIGFTRRRVLVTVLGEACWMTLLGGALGVAIGCLCLQSLHEINTQYFPLSIHEMLGPWLLYLLGIAAAIGLASGLVPAVNAARLSVIDGLRRVI